MMMKWEKGKKREGSSERRKRRARRVARTVVKSQGKGQGKEKGKAKERKRRKREQWRRGVSSHSLSREKRRWKDNEEGGGDRN